MASAAVIATCTSCSSRLAGGQGVARRRDAHVPLVGRREADVHAGRARRARRPPAAPIVGSARRKLKAGRVRACAPRWIRLGRERVGRVAAGHVHLHRPGGAEAEAHRLVHVASVDRHAGHDLLVRRPAAARPRPAGSCAP